MQHSIDSQFAIFCGPPATCMLIWTSKGSTVACGSAKLMLALSLWTVGFKYSWLSQPEREMGIAVKASPPARKITNLCYPTLWVRKPRPPAEELLDDFLIFHLKGSHGFSVVATAEFELLPCLNLLLQPRIPTLWCSFFDVYSLPSFSNFVRCIMLQQPLNDFYKPRKLLKMLARQTSSADIWRDASIWRSKAFLDSNARSTPWAGIRILRRLQPDRFGDGAVAQNMLTNNQRGDFQNISWW